jgi:hypothetical protein
VTTRFRSNAAILGIDPGTEQSALVLFDNGRVLHAELSDNQKIADDIYLHAQMGEPRILCIEMVQSFGMAIGETTIETIKWIGRFQQAWCMAASDDRCFLIKRSTMKAALCGTPRAKDANVRQRIIDLYGGKYAAIGVKKDPGPLYGVSKHMWQALAVIIAHLAIVKFADADKELSVVEKAFSGELTT